MPKQRESIRQAKERQRFESNFERLARDIAFEAGVEIEVRDLSVFILTAGTEEPLCTVARTKRLWGTIWHALNERFPHLRRYH